MKYFTFDFLRRKLLSCNKRAVALIAFSIVAAPIAAVEGIEQPYKTFRLSNGLALNTNSNFRQVSGHPRMSISNHNINDPDQQFQSVRVNSDDYVYFGLRHRSTGKCLNAYNPEGVAGVEVNVWPCDPNDPDQMFSSPDFNGNPTQIKTRTGNFCIHSADGERYGRIVLWNCLPSGDPDKANQTWATVYVD